jgi:predicted DCC family thiol-disulfide oxidoreductase YuxK
VLFYDGSCNLCHASQKQVRSWAEAVGQPLRIEILQGEEAKQKGYQSHLVLEADGKVYMAAEAWLRVMAIAPWYWRWISWARFNPVTKWLAVTFYNFVANNRHKFLGRRIPGIPLPAGGG